MRHLLAVLAVTGCHAAAAPMAPAPAPLSRAEVIARSHAILEAFDRGDTARVAATLSPDYVRFEGSLTDRAHVLEGVARSAADPASGVAQRTWSDEHVIARGNDAIFVGRSLERQAGNDVHGGGYRFDGWYTLVWSRAPGGAWQLVFTSWKIAGGGPAATWNQIFAHATGFEHAPNKLLVTWAARHPAGTALDVAMGQGRNAVYLASEGWKVTGVDISDEGVRQARDAAAAQHLALDGVVADVAAFDYGTERYDLVAMIYAYPAISKLADLQRATRPGGLFVYEFFAPDGSPGDDAPAPGTLARQFAGWDILVDEIVEDVPDWRTDRAKLQRFVARKRPGRAP
jgi:ubiquinone/menaquinone biosynthesis C-methylase UbiE